MCLGYSNERLRQSSETAMYFNIVAPLDRAKEVAREQIRYKIAVLC